MLTKTVDIQQKAILKELLALLEKDTEIILTEGDTPVARLTPVESAETPIKERILGAHPGAWMSDDFDDPLPYEFWLCENP